jgi:hypothetical protein
MLIRRAIAILAILRADAVPILGDFSRDPVYLREGRDDVTYELRLANAARVPANHDDAPLRRGFLVISRQAFPLFL